MADCILLVIHCQMPRALVNDPTDSAHCNRNSCSCTEGACRCCRAV